MSYLLDTNTVSDFYEINSPGHSYIARRLGELSGSVVIFVSVLTLYELESGHANAPIEMRRTIRQRIEAVQNDFIIRDYPPEQPRFSGR